jgi:(p)ppGpp synthase/HD superfamily hydrolase
MYEAERRIEVEWAKGPGESFDVRLVVHSDDRTGLLN